jgi:hypothetical protein
LQRLFHVEGLVQCVEVALQLRPVGWGWFGGR